MESTVATPAPATLPVTLDHVAAAFAQIPDPRRRASVHYPLPAVLALAVSAILCARTSVLAIAESGR